MNPLHALAEAVGLARHWQNYRADWQEVSDETLRTVLLALGFPAASDRQAADSLAELASAKRGLPPMVTTTAGEVTPLPAPPGRYRLRWEDGGQQDGLLHESEGGSRLPAVDRVGYHEIETGGMRATLAVAPVGGFDIGSVAASGRPWALAVQLYALARAGDGGLGDFEGLRRFAIAAARHGADGVAMSPVHAQFSADPDRFSPYSPSSRINLNVLHAPLEFPGQRSDAALVDWSVMSRQRLAALRQEFERASPQTLAGLAAFRAERGEMLETHAVFEALHEVQFGEHGAWHWRTWPEPFRHPSSPAVAQFAQDHQRLVASHAYMQWRADQGLAAAHRAARAAGMPIGLIADLAVGADSGGSHAWSRQDQVLQGLSVGAPPDLLNGAGQNWGLAAFSPTGLIANGFGAFLEMLRAAMRHAGGVRIDHALGLRRLWVVPDGAGATHGAYLHFPQRDLFRLIALESARSRTVVIGEDLGTIPPGFPDDMALAGILGMRVLWFERTWDRFVPPSNWSRAAAAMTSTHDLVTLAGWWQGRDLEWRARLDLAGGAAAQATEGHERFHDRFRLWEAMRENGAAEGDPPPNDEPGRFVDAAIAHTAGAACDMFILPVEDALGLTEQPNLPGTMSDQHPNWQRRLPESVDTLLDAPAVASRLARVESIRTR